MSSRQIRWVTEDMAGIKLLSNGVPSHFTGAEIAGNGGYPALVDQVHLDRLEAFRVHLGKPFRVTSFYRSPEYNRKVRGASASKHVLGQATDFQVPGMTPREVARAAWAFGWRRIGVASAFTHLDSADGEAIWVYGAGSNRPPAPAELVAYIKGIPLDEYLASIKGEGA